MAGQYYLHKNAFIKHLPINMPYYPYWEGSCLVSSRESRGCSIRPYGTISLRDDNLVKLLPLDGRDTGSSPVAETIYWRVAKLVRHQTLNLVIAVVRVHPLQPKIKKGAYYGNKLHEYFLEN